MSVIHDASDSDSRTPKGRGDGFAWPATAVALTTGKD